MKYNYGAEKKRFEKNWNKTYEEYLNAGMAEESIKKMREYDWEMFKQERQWRMHNVYLESLYQCKDNEYREAESDYSPFLSQYFDQMTYSLSDEIGRDGFLGWIKTIEDERLYEAVVALTEEQKMVLSMRIENEMTLREISEEYGISINSVYDRMGVIFRKIKKVMEET